MPSRASQGLDGIAPLVMTPMSLVSTTLLLAMGVQDLESAGRIAGEQFRIPPGIPNAMLGKKDMVCFLCPAWTHRLHHLG